MECPCCGCKLLTVQEIAEDAGVHPQTPAQWIKTGKLPFVRIGSERRGYKLVAESDWLEFKERMVKGEQ